MSSVSLIDATHPVGGDSTNGTYGVRQSLVAIKVKLNEVITQYNALETLVEALPELPANTPLGRTIFNAADEADVFDALNMTAVGKFLAKATSYPSILEQLGFEYGLVGTDRGWIKFGMKTGQESLKINWFNMDIGGYTSLTYPLAFNTKVFAVITGIHSIPDSSWGKNSSIFTDGIGTLSTLSVDVARGGLKSIVAIGI